MRKLLAIVLIILVLKANAGGTSEEVKLLSLVEISEGKYELKYIVNSSSDTITLQLEYNTIQYLFTGMLSKAKFSDGIMLLKQQVKAQERSRLGFFGGGPCAVDKSLNLYRSDALSILSEEVDGDTVVYIFCEYQ